MIQFGDGYRGRRVLITGHTGFKGSWLALWLKKLGAEVAIEAADDVARLDDAHSTKVSRESIRRASFQRRAVHG